MGWSYVPGLAPWDSEPVEPYQGTGPSLQRRSKPLPWPFSPRVNKTAPYLSFLSGTISRPSTATRGVESWISSLRASRVRTSVWPGRALASRANDPDSGLTSSESFARYDPDSCFWRTCQPSLFADWTPSSPAWPNAGCLRSGAVYERPTLAHHMAAIGGGASRGTRDYWVTPDSAMSLGGHLSRGGSRSTEPLLRGQINEWGRNWPTPQTADGERGSKTLMRGEGNPTMRGAVLNWPTPYGFNGQDKDGGYGTGGEFEKYVKNWPTPATRDYRSPNSAESQMRRGRTDETGQQLSNFVAHHWQATRAPWEPCPCCENFLCTIHEMHAHDCDCPSIEEWETDPYFRPDPLTATAGAPTSNATPTSRLQLNPRFVEALMGLAPGWTGFEDWATPWCPSRPKRLSGCSGIAHLDNGRE
jgi:hypothetical protein